MMPGSPREEIEFLRYEVVNNTTVAVARNLTGARAEWRAERAFWAGRLDALRRNKYAHEVTQKVLDDWPR